MKSLEKETFIIYKKCKEENKKTSVVCIKIDDV